MEKINEAVFKTYDVRGIYPQEVDARVAYAVGRATVRYLGAKKIIVGRDMRLGSPKLAQAAIKGVIDEGANVFDIGQVGIELVYFSCGYYKMDGGITITASHNPKEYCGMKLIREKAISLTSGTGLEEVKALSLSQPWLKEKAKPKGRIRKISPWRDYITYIKNIVNPKKLKALRVVLDAENGMGGIILEKILKDSPIKLTILNSKPNGNFPKHAPNPLLVENRVELAKRLKKTKADVGFATDGDGDRVTIIDEKGEFLMTDFVGAMLAEKILKESKHNSVVWTLVRGWSIRDIAKKYNGKFYQTKQGFPFVKLKMREKNSVFGGEPSAHYFYKSFFTSDSGVLTILHTLDLLSKEGGDLSEIVKKFRDNYFMIEETNFETENAEKIFKELEKYYKKRGAKISHLDGVSIDFKDWHANFRASNTEPLIRLNLEANSKSLVIEKTKELKEIIKKSL